MTIRKILVPLNGGDFSAAALMTAVLLARRLDAHVEALHVRIDPADAIPLIGEGVSAVMLEELFEISRREAGSRAADARAIFDKVAAATGLPLAEEPSASGTSLAWREVVGDEDDTVVGDGRLVDLLVLSKPGDHSNRALEMSFEAALFESGRPVLMAPHQEPASIGERVLIAWNGSAEAARSVGFALPILKRANRVTVMTVAAGKTIEDMPKQLATYLAWHGIAVEPRVVIGIGSAEDALADAAKDADLLIMGAYTTSRLRELILGGVTRHMLDTAEVPLFLAH